MVFASCLHGFPTARKCSGRVWQVPPLHSPWWWWCLPKVRQHHCAEHETYRSPHWREDFSGFLPRWDENCRSRWVDGAPVKPLRTQEVVERMDSAAYEGCGELFYFRCGLSWWRSLKLYFKAISGWCCRSPICGVVSGKWTAVESTWTGVWRAFTWRKPSCSKPKFWRFPPWIGVCPRYCEK